ncbi:MAG: methyltransferase domain-containing protein [Alphaproteobacteria bacterium]|nr:methyltransferase domain-containing protein [Alphaproteobacteria bacterium]
MRVFDARALRRHRARAARLGLNAEFLFERAAADLAERLGEIRRRFPVALDFGCRGGVMARALDGDGGVERLISADPSEALARRAPRPAVVLDLEALPFAPRSFDLVLSPLLLHWVNDLPGTLLQLRLMLKPGGLLLATLFGGETLSELHAALIEAELETAGGASPRVSPFADLRDLGGLLQRAGFTDPIIDADRTDVDYVDAFALMRDLRAMGEANAQRERRQSLTGRRTLARAAELYRARSAALGGRIVATFQTINLTAWAPPG